MANDGLDLELFTALLSERQATLHEALSDSERASQTVELDQSRVGRVTRMDAMQAQAMALATGRRKRDELKRISGAFERLAQGDYGYCRYCDDVISPQRLEVDPATLFCINCAERTNRG